ncbi:hypothetical protein [Sorangium sp. So ce385]|uniref:hypothetical protein n=1 Tax=Sorangium sp. So ce385 TaxID=3133308 RepID=UPI003F5B52F1
MGVETLAQAVERARRSRQTGAVALRAAAGDIALWFKKEPGQLRCEPADRTPFRIG